VTIGGTATVLAQSGGSTLTIDGAHFASDSAVGIDGTTTSASLAVAIGGTQCTSFARVSEKKATCTAPAGVGSGLSVSVSVGGQSSESSSLSVAYQQAVVSRASPRAMFIPADVSDTSTVSIVLVGSFLGYTGMPSL